MISSFSREGFGKGRLWVGELPFRFDGSDTLQEMVPSDCSAAVEVVRACGTPGYALVGAELRGIDAGEFRVLVSRANWGSGLPWQGANSKSQILMGIPGELADTVFDSALHTVRMNSSLRAGELHVCCGAYNVVGSSPHLFRICTELLLEVILGNSALGGCDLVQGV